MRLFIFICCTFLLCSCSILTPQKMSSTRNYTMNVWPNKLVIPKQSQSSTTLLVMEPIASPGYQSSKMIYVTVPYELKSFADHRWVAPPSDLLLPLMANRLRAAGYFKAIVTPPFSGAATYQLNTQLLALQQEFLQPNSVVRLVMEVTLINVATGGVMANRVFEITVPANNDPYSGVLATNKAAHQLLDQIAAFVVKHARA